MVEVRNGDDVDLLESSIRTAGGAVFSTTLYVLSGIVYAFVTSPTATGRYFFIALTIALVLRPVRGISQTLQKIGSERGEPVDAYLGLAILFGISYITLASALAYANLESLTTLAVFSRDLFGLAVLFAVSTALTQVVSSLVSAAGYPSAVTWLNSLKSASQLVVLLVFNSAVATAGGLLIVVIGSRLVVYGLAWVWVGIVPSRPDATHLRRAWAFARWSIPDQILDRFSYNMPVYVLGVVATPLAVGVYETADRIADFGATIAWELSSPLLTKVSGDTAAEEDVSTYLGAAVTSGTGVTFLVFGYLLAAHGLLADIAFSATRRAFSTTVLLVGGVNLFRGFWTLASHAIEGVGRPSVSFRTKLLGLGLGLPIPVVYGAQAGAVAGALGYTVMNLAVCGYVVYHATEIFGTPLVDTAIVLRLIVGLGTTATATWAVVRAMTGIGLTAAVVAALAALLAVVVFSTTLGVLSGRVRYAFRQASRIYLGRL